jgi:signal transduction histidine kinase
MIDPDRFDNFLNVSSAQLHSTMTLLENLVAWGNIQLQPQSLTTAAISLKEVVDKVFTELTGQTNLKENRLVNQVNESVMLTMDENVLSFILRNLLTNANKFTDKGSITVEAFHIEKKVIIHVTDTGIGMPATMCERLFLSNEKFSRRGTKNESGSGLGLVLIKEFVEKARGSIAVKSTEGKGSRFTIDIPLQPV